MQTDTITITCSNNSDSSGFVCTTPSIFSGGDMFISLCLVILIVLAIIVLVVKSIFYVKYFKHSEAYFDKGIKEKFDL